MIRIARIAAIAELFSLLAGLTYRNNRLPGRPRQDGAQASLPFLRSYCFA